jgi:hypothetical protein
LTPSGLVLERYGELAQRINIDPALPDASARWSALLDRLRGT